MADDKGAKANEDGLAAGVQEVQELLAGRVAALGLLQEEVAGDVHLVRRPVAGPAREGVTSSLAVSLADTYTSRRFRHLHVSPASVPTQLVSRWKVCGSHLGTSVGLKQ